MQDESGRHFLPAAPCKPQAYGPQGVSALPKPTAPPSKPPAAVCPAGRPTPSNPPKEPPMSKDRDFLRAFSGEDRMTAAQVADKLEQCAHQNRLTHTMFLTPHQRGIAQQVVVCCGTPPHRIMGGHPDAERCLFLFLPDYMDADNILEEELPFGAIRVSWGHGAALTHRDILGSLMAQGVRREVLGRSAPGGDPPFGAAHSSCRWKDHPGYRRFTAVGCRSWQRFFPQPGESRGAHRRRAGQPEWLRVPEA